MEASLQHLMCSPRQPQLAGCNAEAMELLIAFAETTGLLAEYHSLKTFIEGIGTPAFVSALEFADAQCEDAVLNAFGGQSLSTLPISHLEEICCLKVSCQQSSRPTF